MKGKMRKIIMVALSLALIVTNLIGTGAVAKAQATAIVLADKLKNEDLVIVPGQVKHMRIPIRAVGEAMNGPTVILTSPNAPFTLSQATLSMADQSQVANLSNYGTTYVDFDITVKETAKIGSYPITIKVTAKDMTDGATYSQTLDIYVQVLKELAPAQISISDATVKDAIIGGKTQITFTMKNEGEMTARNAYYSIDYGTTGISPDYVTQKIKIDDLAPGATKFVSLPLTILSSATEGLKTLTVNLEYKDADGNKTTDPHSVYVNLKSNDKAPDLMIDSVTYSGDMKPGAKVTVKAVIRNYGSSKANNVTVKLDDASVAADGFYKNYFTESIFVGGIKADGKIDAKIPLVVSDTATNGNKKLNLILAYEDTNGKKYTSNITIYPEVIGASTTSDSGLLITNVVQSPEKPVAGDNMSVTFNLNNTTKTDITQIKIALQGLDGSTFIPVDSEPYQYIEKIAAGKSKKITIPLTVSEKISEGLNNLAVKVTYAGSTATDATTIPIKNVQNDLGTNSKPKLIISKYTVDQDQLRAGSTFNFTFDLYNTHSSVAAKNITVTLTQADNIFTVTQGSNSFFIDKIGAGETVEETVELKVKSDATTKAYPMKITIEYEYEGIKANPETGEVGVTRTSDINLQAVENSRPVVDNVNVYSWDGSVVVGNTATLSFEFYNMGKSVLNNVVATVEGDFTKADGSMLFVGNVEAGSSKYQEFDVIPNVEGTAKGTLKVSFEDSNGDKVEFTKDFEAQVGAATVFDPGATDGSTDVFNPDMPVAKTPILPIWAFILVEIVIAAIFIPVTKRVVINGYKAKLRKKEQEQY